MSIKVALLRDVAKLLKRHKLAELSEAISSLGKRSKSKGRPRTKSPGGGKRATKDGVTKSQQSLQAKPLVRTKKPSSAGKKSRKGNALKSTKSNSRIKSHLSHSKVIDTGRKSRLPDKKKTIVNRDIAHDVKGTRQSFRRTPTPISAERGEDYAKWFRIISGGAGDVKPEDLAANPATGEISKPGMRTEAITHLRIRELLLSGPLKLNSSAPNTSRIISFLPDGHIGMGRTPLAASWRLSQGKLELLDLSGEVRGRFLLSSDGRVLTEIPQLTGPSPRTSQLVRIAAKS